MSGRRLYRPYKIARIVLLVGMAAVLAVIGVLYLNRERERPVETTSSDRVLRPGSPVDLVMAGKGFDYEVHDGERRLFRIQAEEIVSDAEGMIGLTEVRLDIDRDDGVYKVWSDRGVYQMANSIARLEDNVRVEGPDGLVMRTAGLEVVDEGRAISSTAPVLFRLRDELSGRAREAFYHLERNRMRLEGAVRVERKTPGAAAVTTLTCDRLVYDRDSLRGRAEGNVRLTSGASVLEAGRLIAHLAADGGPLELVQARWKVRGNLRSAPSTDLGSDVAFRGETLAVAFTGDSPSRAELEGDGQQNAEIRSLDDSGLERRMTAPTVAVELVAGELDIVRAWNGVEIVESLPFAASMPLRRVCTEWVLVTFTATGDVDQMALQNGVDYQEPGVQATGERIQAAGAGEALDLFGGPAVVRSDRGRFEAPRIAWSGGTGGLRATEGVRAELPESGRFGLIGDSAGKGPIRLTAREATWGGAPAEWSFRGEVRAWQGEDYLLAERLGGDGQGERLTAEGKVKTVVKPPPERDGPVAAAEGAPAAGRTASAADRSPIEVSAEEMVYLRDRRLVTYTGNARAHQSGRTLTCDELDVELGERDRFERMVCTGELVRIRNPDRGHTVEGQRAVYDPGLATVRISGSPVVLEDREGGRVRGPYLIYDLDAGTAQIVRPPEEAGGEGPSAETAEAPAP